MGLLMVVVTWAALLANTVYNEDSPLQLRCGGGTVVGRYVDTGRPIVRGSSCGLVWIGV